jgi:cellulose synthase/poly-beta-1,6-N-acetylglucosamine synthase-like glycosyltransferase
VLTDPVTGRNADGLYWRYETMIKKSEGKLGALLGSNGAIYAIRRELFPDIPSNTLVDDFVIPLLAKIQSNCRIVFEPEAVATEEIAPEIKDEFWRRVRIGAGGYQSIGILWRLLDPRRGWVALAFFSHKVLRWLCPFFLILAFLCTLILLPFRLYQVALVAQLLLYFVAPLLARVPGHGPHLKLIRLTAMFTMMNAALFLGFFRWLRGRSSGVWTRTLRVADGAQSADVTAEGAVGVRGAGQNPPKPAFQTVLRGGQESS